MTESTVPGGHQRHPRENAVDEFTRLVIIFGYLWVLFELLSVHKSILLSEYHLNYPEHAFAIVNSLIFGKLLLTRNCLWEIVVKLSRCVRPKPRPRPRETSLWPIENQIRSLGVTPSPPQ
jgi:hypothetical protein